MHSTTFLFLTILGGFGASGESLFQYTKYSIQSIDNLVRFIGSPLDNEKRQLISFPESFPFQNLSGDQGGALSAIQNNNLGGLITFLISLLVLA